MSAGVAFANEELAGRHEEEAAVMRDEQSPPAIEAVALVQDPWAAGDQFSVRQLASACILHFLAGEVVAVV